MDIEGPTMANNQTIHQWGLHGYGSQKWRLQHVGGGYYSLHTEYISSAYYLGVRDDSTAQDADIVLRYGTVTDGMKWKIQKTASGARRLIPKTGEANGLVLATSTSAATNGAKLTQGQYIQNSNYQDEWILTPAIYGAQTFRTLDSSINEKVNCHGYAMMRNDTPKDWLPQTSAYCQRFTSPSAEFSFEEQLTFSVKVKSDFENWLTNNGYTWSYEADFSGNGESKTLEANQYRVVLRTGLHYYSYKEYYADYHFWYQTYEGRWANKHGQKGAPEYLAEGVTPFSKGTSGWELSSHADFYDSPVYAYIITLP